MKYYKLIDEENYNEVVKDDHGKMYTYQFGTEMWIRSSIMVRYMWPEDSKYDKYTAISKGEAVSLINRKRDELDNLLILAIEVATKAHAGQVDKGGAPYIRHPKAVADAVGGTEAKIVAYLHDICEDTAITIDDLREMGFTIRIVNSVCILTKQEGATYDEYLKEVKKDSNAWHVKIADIKHNMDLSRIPKICDKDIARIDKYKKALDFLMS